MSGRLRYVSSGGDEIGFDGPNAYGGTALDVRADEWDAEFSAHSLMSAVRAARTPALDVAFLSQAEADRAQNAFYRDMAYGAPGTLYATGWRQRCLVTSFEAGALGEGFVRAKLGLALLDGVWRKPERRSLWPQSGDSDGTKAYGYAYPYLYASQVGTRYVNVDAPAPVPFEMVIWGPALSPRVHIGGNTYAFNVDIPDNAYLHVDSRPDPSVTLVLEDGARIDRFDCAVVGTGLGCGTYAFEPISPGRNAVRWNDLFGVDLTLWLERGCPPYDC